MAATVSVVQRIGPSDSFTDQTVSGGTCRFSSKETLIATAATPPITIPAAGNIFSFEKWLSLRIDGTRPADKIERIRAYSDGGDGWPEANLYYKLVSSAAYTQPTATLTSSGLADFFGVTSGSPATLTTGAFSATSTTIGGFLVLSLEVQSSATQGTLTAETITFLYDEI